MRKTGGRKPDKKQFFKLFEAAWREAATVATAQSGFRESGTFPMNRNAIRPEVFEPSKTSDRPLNSEASTSAEAPNEPSSASGTAGPGGKQCSGLIGLRSHLFQLSYPRLLF